MENLNLKELIHTVRQELIDSEKERKRKRLDPLFKVDSLKIEVNFVIEETLKTGGKLGIKIVDVGRDHTYSSQQVHKISLELKTCEDNDIEAKMPFFGRNPLVKNYSGSKVGGSLPGFFPRVIPFEQKAGVNPFLRERRRQKE